MDPSCFDHIDKLSQLWPTVRDTETILNRWMEWAQLRRGIVAWPEDYPLVVSPVTGMAVPLPLDYDHWASTEELERLMGQMRNSLWPACLGLPALALPNGVQLIGAPHNDEALFGPGRVVQATLPKCLPTIVG
ncbi:hypothetical protein FB472_1669 [Rhodoglobus vestalii]|uniref:Amidase n=1 Tax=Rhodoglobus vestalii TaxID=193384 RepID=A0A8H2K6G9_9MICO|nr:hypothetical protein FB472_1669 [Rhodoglobus vestalii]